MIKKKIDLPEDVIWIIQTLQEHKKEAFAVGGCVRDSILGKKPKDWDITTSASPEEVKAIFRKTIDTGILHGTVTVMIGKMGYEVTTYRIDGEYEDCRHPKTVTFTKNLVEDLKRRDFTINAMAYNQEAGLIDAFTGKEDLEKHRIRCVGEAKERFTEDALRMLRAVRFSAQLNFHIEEKTKEAMKELAENISLVSKERIQTELTKLLVSDYPERIEEVFEYGLGKWFFPSYVKWEGKFAKETKEQLKKIRNNSILRWSTFFTILNPLSEKRKKAETILKELKFDNHTIYFVSRLVEAKDYLLEADEVKLRKAIVTVGEDIFPLLLELKQTEYKEKETEEKKIKDIIKLYHGIYKRKDCLSIKDLKLSGKDFIADGMKPGRHMGIVLQRLLEEVLEHPEYNTKEYLLERGKEIEKSILL